MRLFETVQIDRRCRESVWVSHLVPAQNPATCNPVFGNAASFWNLLARMQGGPM